MIEVNGRIAGGGLVLSVDAGQRAVPVDIVPVESALRPDERSARYRHNGAVVWLTGLPGSGKVDTGAGAGAATVHQRRLADPAGWRHPARRPQQRSRFLAAGSQREHPPAGRGRHASGAQRPYRHRRRRLAVGRGPRRRAPHRRHSVPRNPCRDAGRGLREPRPQGTLRQGARRRPAVVHRHRQRLPAAGKMRTDNRYFDPPGR